MGHKFRMPPPKGGKRRRQKKEKLGGGHMKAFVLLLVIKHPSLLITTMPQEGYTVSEFLKLNTHQKEYG
jgi:hypothetical protein